MGELSSPDQQPIQKDVEWSGDKEDNGRSSEELLGLQVSTQDFETRVGGQ